jgi:hypothetical protein
VANRCGPPIKAVTTRSTTTFERPPSWEKRCGTMSSTLEKMMKARS